MVAIRQGSIGHLRYVMKDTLQMVPLYGLYFYEHGCIYVKRGEFKQKKMESSLEYLQDPKIKVYSLQYFLECVKSYFFFGFSSRGLLYSPKEHVSVLLNTTLSRSR